MTTVRVHGFNPVRDLLKLNKADGSAAWNLDLAMKTIAASDRGVLVWIGQDHLEDLGHAIHHLNQPKPLKSNAALPSNIKPLVSVHKFYVIWVLRK